jgi:hypothetical protein
MATHLGGFQPLHTVLQHFGAGETMSPKLPVGIQMVWLGGVFGSPQSGAHLPDGGASESATRFARVDSWHHAGHIFYILIFGCHQVWECLVLGEGRHIHPEGKCRRSGGRISLLGS